MNVVKDQSVVDKEKAGIRKGKVSPFCGIRGAEGVSDGFCLGRVWVFGGGDGQVGRE